jgi:hypothetical protein
VDDIVEPGSANVGQFWSVHRPRRKCNIHVEHLSGKSSRRSPRIPSLHDSLLLIFHPAHSSPRQVLRIPIPPSLVFPLFILLLSS